MEPLNEVDEARAQRIFSMLSDTKLSYTESQIARMFKTYPRAVKPILNTLVERGEVCMEFIRNGKAKAYSAVANVPDKTLRRGDESQESFKPLSNDYLRMMAFRMQR